MALAKQGREMAAVGRGCLGKAADDEPVFVLRAKDLLAPGLVENWANKLEAYDKSRVEDSTVQMRRQAKIKEARALAHQMRAWQALNTSKMPD
jgi:hypothetical protein